jgi:hypothetical protein
MKEGMWEREYNVGRLGYGKRGLDGFDGSDYLFLKGRVGGSLVFSAWM